MLISAGNETIVEKEKSVIADWTTLIFTLILVLSFFSLNYKVNTLTAEEINVYPNYFYIYGIQLIAFQVFSLLLLLVLYSRHKQMIKCILMIKTLHLY